MRRCFSLALLAVLVVLTVVVSTRYLSPRNQAAHRVAAAQRDSLARLDSTYRAEGDTMCFASRIGLPCNPR